MVDRRSFLRKSGQLGAGALAGGVIGLTTSEADAQPQAAASGPSKKLKIMMKSAWGSDDPTRASFVFSHALALADAGHEVQIFITGEATNLMRKPTVEAIKPIGWPPLSETMQKVVAKRIPIFS